PGDHHHSHQHSFPTRRSSDLPGDHLLPHDDRLRTGENDSRQLAFVWHLTKNWRPTWGGDFYWCPEDRYFTPVFNTLMLFTVGSEDRTSTRLNSSHDQISYAVF